MDIKSTMIQAALSGGEILEKYYGRELDIKDKDGRGLVSQADKEAEEKILAILLKEHKYNVIAEESGEVNNHSEYCWIIDPLDGTTNYTRQIPFFCVSVSLFKNNQPEAAVIYQPLTKEMFYAEHGKGAFLNGNKLENTSGTNPALIDCNLGYSEDSVRTYLNALNCILPNYQHIRNLGSSALELAYLAAGRLDCFMSYGDEIYDIAAGILIAQEAGYRLSNWKGESWQIGEKGLLVASPLLLKEIIKHLTDL